MHPRTLRNLESTGDDARLRDSGVLATEPHGYLDFLCLEADAAFVLTDSGGIQEETTALGVRCFTLRDSTERRVTEELGTNTVLGAKPERIAEIPQLLERPKPGEVVPVGRVSRRASGRGPLRARRAPMQRTAQRSSRPAARLRRRLGVQRLIAAS